MKKILLLFIIVPLLSFNSSISEKNIIGKWKGEDGKNIIGLMIFENDGYATIEINGEIYGGKEFEINGEKGSMRYSTNFDLDPIQIDLIITFLESKDQIKMLFIAEFQDKDTIILASKFSNKRPTEFNSNNSAILHRIK